MDEKEKQVKYCMLTTLQASKNLINNNPSNPKHLSPP